MGCVNTKKGAVFSPTFFCVTHSLRGGGNLWQETQRQRQLAPSTAPSTRYRRLRSRDGRCRFRYSTLLRLSLHQCKAVAHTAHTVPPTVASVPHSQPHGTHIHSYTLICTHKVQFVCATYQYSSTRHRSLRLRRLQQLAFHAPAQLGELLEKRRRLVRGQLAEQ